MSHNGISKMEGLSTLVNLHILDVSNNKLTSVNGIENLTMYVFYLVVTVRLMLFCLSYLILPYNGILVYRLEDLWLNDNSIDSVEGIAEVVAGSREKLTTIYLENNPCVWLSAT